MTTDDAGPQDHPWYLDLRPDLVGEARDSDAFAALRALDAVGATVLAVHTEKLPSLADLIARRCYIGWTIAVPGSVERATIEDIAAMAGAGYRVTFMPGHPLPPATDPAPSPAAHDRVDRHAVFPRARPQHDIVTPRPAAGA